jgi:preprotein translocase subunit SecG
MTILFVILVFLAAGILGLIVLIQNHKCGGLAGNIAVFSNQFMGVKQTTDVLEKGTWLFAGIVGLLCLVSTFFMSAGGTTTTRGKATDASVPAVSQPATTPGQLPANAAPIDTGK